MTLNHYPIGEVTDRPEWTAARARTPEEAQGVLAANLSRALIRLESHLRAAAERFSYPQTIDTEVNR